MSPSLPASGWRIWRQGTGAARPILPPSHSCSSRRPSGGWMSAPLLRRRVARLLRDAEMWAVRRGSGVSKTACGWAASQGGSDGVSAAGSLEPALMWAAWEPACGQQRGVKPGTGGPRVSHPQVKAEACLGASSRICFSSPPHHRVPPWSVCLDSCGIKRSIAE